MARKLLSSLGKNALLFTRDFHQHRQLNAARQFTEVQIPVPWGHIAGKLWGPVGNSGGQQPILSLHGWQDNAGTFDTLIPHLSEKCSFLAIDLPGHGLSSWLPKGSAYTEIIYLQTLLSLKKHFGWNDLKLLVHSFSGVTGFTYASLYPEETRFVISLDALTYNKLNIHKYIASLSKSIKKLVEIEARTTPTPTHQETELIARWMKATMNSIDEQATKTLMIRGAKQHEDGTYSLKRDPKLTADSLYWGFTHTNTKEIAKRIVCPYYVLKAEESFLKTYMESQHIEEIMDIIKSNSKDFRFTSLPGTHHFHLLTPEVVATAINPFLEQYYE